MRFELVFEDPVNRRNLLTSRTVLDNGQIMHGQCFLLSNLLNICDSGIHGIGSRPPVYIFPIGLYHHPWQWAGHRYNPVYKTSAFEMIPIEIIEDVRKDKALLLFDQGQEGSQERWLYDWFHDNIKRTRIPPHNVVYCTGDLTSSEHYDRYCLENNIKERMNVLSDVLVQCYDLCLHARNQVRLPSWNDHLVHKSSNESRIKLYNCLNRRVYSGREWMFLRLAEEGLLDDGLISMDGFETPDRLGRGIIFPPNGLDNLTASLPMRIDMDGFDHNPCIDLNPSIYLDSWFTIITETTATDNEDSVMITEKTFKPILSCHPFIVWGNRTLLRHLRELGFKTFDGMLDESYDSKHDFYRLEQIIESIKSIRNIRDRLEWFKRCEDVVCHNQELASKMSWLTSRQYLKLRKIWDELVARNLEGRLS